MNFRKYLHILQTISYILTVTLFAVATIEPIGVLSLQHLSPPLMCATTEHAGQQEAEHTGSLSNVQSGRPYENITQGVAEAKPIAFQYLRWFIHDILWGWGVKVYVGQWVLRGIIWNWFIKGTVGRIAYLRGIFNTAPSLVQRQEQHPVSRVRTVASFITHFVTFFSLFVARTFQTYERQVVIGAGIIFVCSALSLYTTFSFFLAMTVLSAAVFLMCMGIKYLLVSKVAYTPHVFSLMTMTFFATVLFLFGFPFLISYSFITYIMGGLVIGGLGILTFLAMLEWTAQRIYSMHQRLYSFITYQEGEYKKIHAWAEGASTVFVAGSIAGLGWVCGSLGAGIGLSLLFTMGAFGIWNDSQSNTQKSELHSVYVISGISFIVLFMAAGIFFAGTFLWVTGYKILANIVKFLFSHTPVWYKAMRGFFSSDRYIQKAPVTIPALHYSTGLPIEMQIPLSPAAPISFASEGTLFHPETVHFSRRTFLKGVAATLAVTSLSLFLGGDQMRLKQEELSSEQSPLMQEGDTFFYPHLSVSGTMLEQIYATGKIPRAAMSEQQLLQALCEVTHKTLGFSGKPELTTNKKVIEAAQAMHMVPGRDFTSVHWSFALATEAEHISFFALLEWLKDHSLGRPITIVVHPFEWQWYVASMAHQMSEQDLLKKAAQANVRIAFETTVPESWAALLGALPRDLQEGQNMKCPSEWLYEGYFERQGEELIFVLQSNPLLYNRLLRIAQKKVAEAATRAEVTQKASWEEISGRIRTVQNAYTQLGMNIEHALNDFIPDQAKQFTRQRWQYGDTSFSLFDMILKEDFVADAAEAIKNRRTEPLSEQEMQRLKEQMNAFGTELKMLRTKTKVLLKEVLSDAHLGDDYYQAVFSLQRISLGRFTRGKTDYVDAWLQIWMNNMAQRYADEFPVGMCIDFLHIADKCHASEYAALYKAFQNKSITLEQFRTKIMQWTQPYLARAEYLPCYELHFGEIGQEGNAAYRNAYLNKSAFPVRECLNALMKVGSYSTKKAFAREVDMVVEADISYELRSFGVILNDFANLTTDVLLPSAVLLYGLKYLYDRKIKIQQQRNLLAAA